MDTLHAETPAWGIALAKCFLMLLIFCVVWLIWQGICGVWELGKWWVKSRAFGVTGPVTRRMWWGLLGIFAFPWLVYGLICWG